MATGLIIGRCDAAWRPDRDDLYGGPGAADDAEELRRRCRDLRLRLREADDPRHQVLLLRRLAEHRAALIALDPEWATVELLTSDTAEHPAVTTPAAHATAPAAAGDSNGDGRAAAAIRAEEATPDWVGPAGERPLALRFLVEGPPGAGTSTIVEQMATHFEAELATAAVGVDGLQIHFLDFSAGSFEGRPIRFEVCSASGPTDRAVRRYLRTLVDSVILVVEATAAGVADGRTRLDELLADHAGRRPHDRADLTVFAHKGDLDGALAAAEVAAALDLGDEVKVVATTWERRGSSHGLALATSSALRRLQRRDAEDRPRTVGLSARGFLTVVRGGLPAPTPVAGPAAADTSVADPRPAEPAAVDPVAVHPVTAHQATAGSAAVEPVPPDPVAAAPVVVDLVAATQGAADPAVAAPESAEPVAADPVPAGPITAASVTVTAPVAAEVPVDRDVAAVAEPAAAETVAAAGAPTGDAVTVTPADGHEAANGLQPSAASATDGPGDRTGPIVSRPGHAVVAGEPAVPVPGDAVVAAEPAEEVAARVEERAGPGVGQESSPSRPLPYPSRAAEVAAAVGPDLSGHLPPRFAPPGRETGPTDHVDPAPPYPGRPSSDPGSAIPRAGLPSDDPGSAIPRAGLPSAGSGAATPPTGPYPSGTHPTPRATPAPDLDTVNLRVVTRRRPGASVGSAGAPSASPGDEDTIRLEEEPVRRPNGGRSAPPAHRLNASGVTPFPESGPPPPPLAAEGDRSADRSLRRSALRRLLDALRG